MTAEAEIEMKGHNKNSKAEKNPKNLVLSLRKVVFLESLTCYPKYKKVSKMLLVVSLTVAHRLERYQNFLITISNQWCKVVSFTLKTLNIFLEKVNTLGCIPDNAILVTADVVGLYPSIPHQVGLITLKEALEKRLSKKIPTGD